MLERYKTVYQGGEAEITEKKSRFIGTVRPVETEEEALAFLEEMRKKYWDATHNCFAYVAGERREWVRAADDGEPSGTAGRPMLDVLLGEDLYNTAVVVTRYFRGTLLGTGGLVRAYSRAVQEALKACEIVEKRRGALLEIRADYTDLGKIQYILGQRNLPILRSDYTERVLLEVILPAEEQQGLRKALTEATGGRAAVQETGNPWYARIRGEVKLF